MIKKFLLAIITLIILAYLGALVYFNGSRVKGPLIALIKEQTNLTLEVENIDYSLLYPSTIKLYNASIDDLKASEIYFDLDLIALIKDKNLVVKDLYFKDLVFDESKLKLDKLEKYRLLNIQALRLENSSLRFDDYNLDEVNLNLRHLYFTDDSLKARSGTVAISKVNHSPFDNYKLKTLNFEFSYDGENYEISNFFARMLSGELSGRGIYHSGLQDIEFQNLNINKVMLQDLKSYDLPFNITANEGIVSNVSLYTDKYNVQEITGRYDHLKINKNSLEASFKGNVFTINDKDNIFRLENNSVELNLNQDLTDFRLEADFLAGKVQAQGSFKAQSKDINLDKLTFSNNKFHTDDSFKQKLSRVIEPYNIHVNQFALEKIEFLSFLDKIKLSIADANVSASAFSIKKGKFDLAQASIFNVNLHNVLYHDLLIKEVVGISTLSEQFMNFSFPKILFSDSHLSLLLSLSNNKSPSFLLLQANDFNLENLNSNLIPHFMAGKVNFLIDVKSLNGDLLNNAYGYINADAEEILVSKLGLDLLNGGSMKSHKLKLSELYDKLAQGDVGIYKVKLQGQVNHSNLELDSTFKLASSYVRGNSYINLKNYGHKSSFVLDNGENRTELLLKGNLNQDIQAELKPMRRGIQLAGLFDNFNQESQAVKLQGLDEEGNVVTIDGNKAKVQIKKKGPKLNPKIKEKFHQSAIDQVQEKVKSSIDKTINKALDAKLSDKIEQLKNKDLK